MLCKNQDFQTENEIKVNWKRKKKAEPETKAHT